MKDLGREVPEVSRRRLLEELKGLFGPAFGPALEAYGRTRRSARWSAAAGNS
jgi:hypothetical protein